MITKEFVNCHGKALLLSLSFSLAWFLLAAWILNLPMLQEPLMGPSNGDMLKFDPVNNSLLIF
jgi:hypothetical protein